MNLILILLQNLLRNIYDAYVNKTFSHLMNDQCRVVGKVHEMISALKNKDPIVRKMYDLYHVFLILRRLSVGLCVSE